MSKLGIYDGKLHKCQKCGCTRFKIRMDDDWDKLGEDDNLNGHIECAICGKIFMELGR